MIMEMIDSIPHTAVLVLMVAIFVIGCFLIALVAKLCKTAKQLMNEHKPLPPQHINCRCAYRMVDTEDLPDGVAGELLKEMVDEEGIDPDCRAVRTHGTKGIKGIPRYRNASFTNEATTQKVVIPDDVFDKIVKMHTEANSWGREDKHLEFGTDEFEDTLARMSSRLPW